MSRKNPLLCERPYCREPWTEVITGRNEHWRSYKDCLTDLIIVDSVCILKWALIEFTSHGGRTLPVRAARRQRRYTSDNLRKTRTSLVLVTHQSFVALLEFDIHSLDVQVQVHGISLYVL